MRTEDLADQIAQSIREIEDPNELFETTRLELSAIRPQQALTICFKKNIELDDKLREVVCRIRSEYPTRRAFLSWIYEKKGVIDDLSFVRLPSTKKLALVQRFIKKTRSRYPWMNSRLIHVMAFRPEFFDTRQGPEGRESWGPLYRKKIIAKGRRSNRILEIPNPPLRRLQRVILDEILTPAMEELPQYITGCRGGNDNSTVFDNAAFHIGQEYIITLDIKNFFGSIRLWHIIPALTSLKRHMVEERVDARDGEKQFIKYVAHSWDKDSAVLIGRLTTFRGRLPQGAPTSSAIANIAFCYYDHKIVEQLGKSFIYTRYVDDITISISRQAAKKLGIKCKSVFKQCVLQAVESALEGSNFTINHQKTRVGTIAEGHRVTGLRVIGDSVTLPRNLKRYIRTLTHNINHGNFVTVADQYIGNEVATKTRFVESIPSLPRQHRREGRRISTEKLAVLMLKILCPDPRILIPSSVSNVYGNRVFHDAEDYHGRTAWKYIERLLTYLWKNEVFATYEPENMIIVKNAQELEIGRIEAEANLDFFRLTKKEAVTCVEFWHHIRGLKSYLHLKSAASCFREIREWHDKLDAVFRKISISVARERVVEPMMKDTSTTITISDKQEVGSGLVVKTKVGSDLR